jgi:phosphoglucomutase
MAAYEKNKGRSLFDKLLDLYVQYGFYKESLVSITKKGMNGAAEIGAMMEQYRNNPPKTIDGVQVKEVIDYKLQVGKNIVNAETWKIDLPKSDVLQFVLGDGTKISARPSGTEPKIKFYFSVNAPLKNTADFDKVEKELDDKIARIEKDMGLK